MPSFKTEGTRTDAPRYSGVLLSILLHPLAIQRTTTPGKKQTNKPQTKQKRRFPTGMLYI